MAIFRDSKGRFRNSEKITPENQERLYRGESLKIEPILTEISSRKKTIRKGGKTIIKIEKVVKYVNSEGKKRTETDFKRWNYLRGLNKDNREIIDIKETFNFGVLGEIKNAAIEGKTILYKGKEYTPKELFELTKNIRNELNDKAKRKEYPIFRIEVQNNGNLTIKQFGSTSDIEGTEEETDETEE
jgi:hypothetical protein